MEWRHKVSLDWLRERQKYLTASELHNLLPITKSGSRRNKATLDKAVVDTYARKSKILTEDDCCSYGAAARGHILEPYIIEKLQAIGYTAYHWDDALLYNEANGISFSPDGMSVPQHSGVVGPSGPAIFHQDVGLFEIKCYNAENHFNAIISDKMELVERYQLATAMAACENIKLAVLAFANPSVEVGQLAIFEYTRADLDNEIAQVLKAAENYYDMVDKLVTDRLKTLIADNVMADNIYIDEYSICLAHQDELRINPSF